MTAAGKVQRVQEAVRRHARTRAFVEAEDVFSAVLSDPGVREARDRVEAAETELGRELCGHLQPFQDRYDQAVAGGRRERARRALRGQARPLGPDLRAARRARDLNGGTALGPHQRGPANRMGGQRTRRLVSSSGETDDRTPGRRAARGLSLSGASGAAPRPYTH